MSNPWENIIAIHDTSHFEHIGVGVKGVQFYSDRALLLPAEAAVIQDDGDDLDRYLEWLKIPGVCLGPRRVIRVKKPNLLEGLAENPAAIEDLQAHARHNGLIQFFCTTIESEEFCARHGIQRHAVHSAPLFISQIMNDKAELRRIGVQCGREQAFLPHVASRDPQKIMAAARDLLAKGKRALVRRTDLAGGSGMLRIDGGLPEGEAEKKIVAFLREHHRNEILLTSHNEATRENSGHKVLSRREVADHDAVAETIRSLFAAADHIDYVLVQRKNLVGGASLKIRRRAAFEEDLRQFLMSRGRNEILVEEWIDCESYSTQIIVDHGHLLFLGPTKQIVDDDGRHMGNIMVRYFPSKGSVAEMTYEDKVWMEMLSRDLTAWAHTRVDGVYRGTIGFDFLKRMSDGRIFVSECNGRQTASTYPLAVNHQLEGRLQEPFNAPRNSRMNWGIIMHNAVPTRSRSWGSLVEKLGGLLFQHVQGAIPFNIRLMKMEEPAVGIVAVGKNLRQAHAVMRLARKRLAT